MKKFNLFVFLFFVLGMASAVGDRLIFSINNLSYSQRQIEVTFYIKEALREETASNPELEIIEINQENWQSIMKVFAEDMIVLQEAVRLGSFQINTTALQKYKDLVSIQVEKSKFLQTNFERLGVDKKTLHSEIDNVLRVAGFRKSKRRQNKNDAEITNLTTSQSKWLSELTDRTVIRTYEGAQKYILIQPQQGPTANE